jgi:phospholipid/cholesterol/gamma-HCH transport system substrate-binding protein
MLDKTKKIELKVGIFVFIGIIILIMFVLMIGDFRLVNPGYRFKISFNFANGVKMSAPVRLSGVEVGEVKGIEIGYDDRTKKPLVLIDVWVKKDARVPMDSRVWVNMLGLLGEKYIEIIPGQNYAALLREGSLIKGEDPISIQELTDLSRNIALQVGYTVMDVSLTLTKLDTTLDSLNLILTNVKQGEGTIGKLFFDNSLYNNIDEMFADLKKHPWKLLYRPKENN